MAYRRKDASRRTGLRPCELVAFDDENDGLPLVVVRHEKGGTSAREIGALLREGPLRVGAEVIAEHAELGP
jgi:hypothetical protein